MFEAPREPDWLSVAEARAAILAGVDPLPPERVALVDGSGALGRVLAEDIVSPVDLPPWDNSAMDGFAVRAEDVRGASEERPRVLDVVDDVPAGGFPQRAVGAGQAARVMTGAPVPEGADGVIRVEHTDGGAGLGTSEARVRIVRDSDAGRNIRGRGEDLSEGTRVLGRGTPVRAAEVGVLASLGRSRVLVTRRPEVAVLSSGDELVGVEDFAAVAEGRKIVSTNTYSLAAQLAESDISARVLGIACDTPESLREHLERARGCDALITTGGISVGEHDYTREVLEEFGLELGFWRVRVRPGSPLAFGHVAALDGIPWFGLPGNPVSAMVTFEVLVRPALLAMAGQRALFAPTVPARLEDDYRAKQGLTHFLRVRLEPEGDDGVWRASLTGAQGSGILSSMAAADALLVIPEEPSKAADEGVFRALVLGGAPPSEEPGY